MPAKAECAARMAEAAKRGSARRVMGGLRAACMCRDLRILPCYDAPVPVAAFDTLHIHDCEEVTLRFSKSVLLIPAALLAISPVAFGSGFGLFEQGAKATA